MTTKQAATVLGYIISPLILPPLFFWWMAVGLGWPAMAVAIATALPLVFLGLLPLAVIAWMVIWGDARSLEVRDRTKRLPAFLWAVGFGVAGVVAATLLSWPHPGVMPALLAIFPVNSVLLAVINTRTKISVHSASIAATAAISVWMVARHGFAAPFATAAAISTPLVMWSRVAAGAHTRNQVLLGALFGLVLPVTELYLFTAVGWLRIP